MKLNDLRPNKGSKKKRKRVGRGISAGQGKTAGRGTKGQGARSGGGKGQYFEGGQLPLVRRLPFKRGFTNINKVYYKPVNVGSLEHFTADSEVDPDALYEAGLLKKPTDLVVILGEGEVSIALSVKAHRFSAAAKSKIEAAGGSVSVIKLQ
ncbi:MAG: 50S ribosomal protein L15 [Chloroflexota bacterium]|jgi:large subunit ribosomal protein L15